jgi:hypothetical protein
MTYTFQEVKTFGVFHPEIRSVERMQQVPEMRLKPRREPAMLLSQVGGGKAKRILRALNAEIRNADRVRFGGFFG